MIAYIVILWIIMQLNAPIWCYVLVVMGIVVKVIYFFLRIIGKALEGRIDALNKEIEDDLDSM